MPTPVKRRFSVRIVRIIPRRKMPAPMKRFFQLIDHPISCKEVDLGSVTLAMCHIRTVNTPVPTITKNREKVFPDLNSSMATIAASPTTMAQMVPSMGL